MIRTILLTLCLVSGSVAFTVTGRASAIPTKSSFSSPTALGPIARNGLTYEDIEVGEGRRVNPGDTILCYYEGSFLQGDGPFAKSIVFDATEPGEPIEFLVGKGQLISGMDTGICGDYNLEIPPMNIGGDRKLKIPSPLAYGEAGAGGGAIPPNTDLFFQISVLNAETKGGISAGTKLKGYGIAFGFAAVVLSIGFFIFTSF